MSVSRRRVLVALRDVLERIREQLPCVGLLQLLAKLRHGLLLLRLLGLVARHHIIWQQHIRKVTSKEALTHQLFHVGVFFFLIGEGLRELIDLHPAHFLGN